ncbi:hypothetical protein VKT23_020785 [Stygiomarasmius scandens]|uniref:Uncharacterized protein n=1 Tax=Marasmiellus scandens TaxID=2682957 RepID=A0ABR1JDH6_9AGAR
MLLQATTGDSPQQAHARRMGPPVVYPPHAYSHLPPPLTVPHAHPHGYAPVSAGSAGSSHSHRYTSNSESPPISRREPSYEYSRERERAHSQSQYHQPQLVVRESLPTPTSTQPQAGKIHMFVPIQTGAPVKKGRWSANMDAPQSSTSPTNGAGVPHSTTMPAITSSHQHQPLQASASTLCLYSNAIAIPDSISASQPSTSAATAPFPPTNPSGQRICRQYGALGRYKDGKCVEKWGPGPCGPEIVCDHCMKRVERSRMAALGEDGGPRE